MRLLVLLLCAAAAYAQPTRSDLRRRFGTPDAERYAARTGVSAMAAYGSGGKVCELLIEPRPASIVAADPNAALASLDRTDVDQILDDLVPAGTRIGTPQTSAIASGNVLTEQTRYDNLTVVTVRSFSPQHEVKWAFVQWKAEACTLARDDLRSRYGEADVERFSAGDGVSLTVAYDAHGTASEAMAQPRPPSISPLLSAHPQASRYMSRTVTDRLLNELAPVASRRGQPRSWLSSLGCPAQFGDEFDNITTGRGVDQCREGQDEQVTSLTIRWKPE